MAGMVVTGETAPEASLVTRPLPRVRARTGTGTGPGVGLLQALAEAETSAAGTVMRAQMTGIGVVGMRAGDTAVTERAGSG